MAKTSVLSTLALISRLPVVFGHGGGPNQLLRYILTFVLMSVLESTYGSTHRVSMCQRQSLKTSFLPRAKAIIQDTHGLFVSNGCYAIPTLLIHQMLEVVETCIEGIPFVPNDEANSQARGLGNMVAF